MSSRRPFLLFAIAAGWLLLVAGAVRLLESGLGFWRGGQEELAQAQATLRRMEGWLAVEAAVAARRDEVLGSRLAHAAVGDLSWAALDALQQAAQAEGLSVAELRPSSVRGQEGEGSRFRLDAKIEGALTRIGGLLQQLPEALPGLRLDSLQLTPREKDSVQALLRISLPQGAQGER